MHILSIYLTLVCLSSLGDMNREGRAYINVYQRQNYCREIKFITKSISRTIEFVPRKFEDFMRN